MICKHPEAWHDGSCCCNCVFHTQDFKHCCVDGQDPPPNKCVCSQPKGWICDLSKEGGRAHSGWPEHSFCEMHRA